MPRATIWSAPDEPKTVADSDYASELKQAESALSKGQADEAARLFQRANKRKGGASAECYWGLARAHLRRGDEKRTLESCEWLLSNAPNDLRAQALNLKGVVLTRSQPRKPEKLEQAEQALRAALLLQPQNPVFQLNLATVLLKQNKSEAGVALLERYLEVAPYGPTSQRARKLMENPHLVDFDFAPEFSLRSAQGESLSLSGLEGKIVVLDFWATWCPPCVASVGELRDLVRKYPRDKLVLISISVDEDEKEWSEFIARKHMDWPQFRDTEREIVGLFQVNSFPTYVVIDSEGAVRKRLSGMNPKQSLAGRIKSELQALLQEKK